VKKFISASFVALCLIAGSAHAAVQTIKAEVNGMVCAFCAQGIEKKMRALSQTKDVYVNLKQKVVVVEIKEGQTLSPDTVKDLVKDAGYDVTSIQTVNETAQEIKAKMRKE
jgi:mercuric ion binding protein